MKPVAMGVYGLFAALGILLGFAALLKPELALPPGAYSPVTAHLVREQGAEGVFIGLMALWCLAHFKQRRPVHYALLVFATLFALIHWDEFVRGNRPFVSPLVNSVPFLLLIATAPWAKAEGSQRG